MNALLESLESEQSAGIRALEDASLSIARDIDTAARKASGDFLRPGARLGGSVVKERSGNSPKGAIWEVSCCRCGAAQFRSASELRFSRMRGRQVWCPECLHEDQKAYAFSHARALTRRVKGGGPTYTRKEVLHLQRRVLEDLEMLLGPAMVPAELRPEDMRLATGFPASTGDRAWQYAPIPEELAAAAAIEAAIPRLVRAMGGDDGDVREAQLLMRPVEIDAWGRVESYKQRRKPGLDARRLDPGHGRQPLTRRTPRPPPRRHWAEQVRKT